jgi:hypothetical protein
MSMATDLSQLPDPLRAAQWISQSWGRDAQPVGGHPIAFRAVWNVPEKLESATITICGWPRYRLFVNGEIAGHGPARSFPEEVFYDTFDTSPLIVEGANHIAVILQPFTGVTGYEPTSRLGLLAAGEAIAANGSAFAFASDASWSARAADWYADEPNLISLPVGFQEHYRANLEPEDWKLGACEDGWGPVFIIGPAGTPPWLRIAARPVAKLVETPALPRLLWRANLPAQKTPTISNLAHSFNVDVQSAIPLTLGDSEWIDTADGNLVAFDLGKTRLARPGLAVASCEGDVRLECFYSTTYEDRPKADSGFNGPREGACDSFEPVAGRSSQWLALAPRGFRYICVRQTGSGRCRFRLDLRHVEYPYPERASPAIDDPELQVIWHTAAETLRSATNDTFVDCCSRENVLWTLDACISGKAAFYTFGDTAMWGRCLRLIGQGIDGQGVPMAVVPAHASFMCLIDQALAWVGSCRDYENLTGDPIAADVAESVRRLLTLCAGHITTDGLFAPPAYAWHWVDWAPIDRSPYSLPINALLLLAADAAQSLAASAGYGPLLDLAERLAVQLRPRLSAFYDEDSTCFIDHLEPEARDVPVARVMLAEPAAGHGVHANSLACLAGVGTHEQRAAAMAHVVKLLEKPLDRPSPFGPGWTDTLLSPLFDYGYECEAIAFVKRAYGIAIDAGAPTFGEGFHGGRDNSAHGWGSSVNSLIAERIAAGSRAW